MIIVIIVVITIKVTAGLHESSPQFRTGFENQRLAVRSLSPIVLWFFLSVPLSSELSESPETVISPSTHPSAHPSIRPFILPRVQPNKVSLRFFDFCSLQQRRGSSVKQGTPSLPSPRGSLKGHRRRIWRSGAPGHFPDFHPLTFNPGSWMQRLSNLQKAVKRRRGWRGTHREEGKERGEAI